MAKIIPILRIFDYKKAIEFYIDWLEFAIDWENTFKKNAPVYLQISKGDLVIHLSEHHAIPHPEPKYSLKIFRI